MLEKKSRGTNGLIATGIYECAKKEIKYTKNHVKQFSVSCNHTIILVLILVDTNPHTIYVYCSAANYLLVLNISCINKTCMINNRVYFTLKVTHILIKSTVS